MATRRSTSTGSTGDSQEFLLDMPLPMETITLGDLKRKIAEVTAELETAATVRRSTGSVSWKSTGTFATSATGRGKEGTPTAFGISITALSPASPQAPYSIAKRFTLATQQIARCYLGLRAAEHPCSTLRPVIRRPPTGTEMGEYDTIKYDEMVKLARPIPAGEYRFELKESWPNYALCNFVISNEWTVTAVAPAGVLHEALFDPVTDGSAVAADSSNGVLDPASFTDAGGATTTIERIEWEAGTVKLKLTPHTALTGPCRGLHRAGRHGVAVPDR